MNLRTVIVDSDWITSDFVKTVRELALSVGVTLIIVPIALYVSYREFGDYALGAVMIGAAATLFGVLLTELEKEKMDRDQAAAFDDFVDRARLASYALTEHRLTILRKRGVSRDVIGELMMIAQSHKTVIAGSILIPEIEHALGPARFRDEIRGIVAVHDVSKAVEDLK